MCKFDTLIRELSIDQSSLTSLLYEIVLSGAVNAKINLVKSNIEMLETSNEKETTLMNFKNWLSHLYNQ